MIVIGNILDSGQTVCRIWCPVITLGKKVSQSFFRNFYKNVFAPFCNLPCQKWDGSILVGCFSWSWQVMIANHFILHSLGLILLDLQMSNVHENTRLPTPDRVRESATAPSWTKMSSACNDNIFVRNVDKFWCQPIDNHIFFISCTGLMFRYIRLHERRGRAPFRRRQTHLDTADSCLNISVRTEVYNGIMDWP